MRVTALKQVTYDPSIFMDVDTVDEAMRIILTPEAGMTSAHRWKTETPYLMALMERHIGLDDVDVVLDYGCGIGRLSKPIIQKYGGIVIGTDVSANMRALASSCVSDADFVAMHPNMLEMFGSDFANSAIAIWTLQHCFEPDEDIKLIRQSIVDGAPFFVVNNVRRVVPVGDGRWADDQIDIDARIRAGGFELIERGTLDDDAIAPAQLRDNTFWAAYRKS